jgi:hypothetical protein
MKRAKAMAARGMAAVTRVAGNEEGDGEGAREEGMIWCLFLWGRETGGARGGKNKVGPKKSDGFLPYRT